MSDAPEFINPNLHVILVHYPIALFVLGMGIECFAWLGWRRSGFRAAGRWMIFLGVLSGIPTAFAGLYALSDVARMGLEVDVATGPWFDMLAASPLVRADGGAAWEMAQEHAWINGLTTAALTFVVVAWVGASDVWRRRLYWPGLLALLVGLGGVSVGAWHGGEMVYRHGVGVEEGESLVALGAPRAGGDVFALQTGDAVPAGPVAPPAPVTAPATAPGAAAPAPTAAAPAATAPEMPIAALGPVQPTPPDPTAPPPMTPATVAAAPATQPATAATATADVESPAAPTMQPVPAPATPPAAEARVEPDAAATATPTQPAPAVVDAPDAPAAKPVEDVRSADNIAAADQREYKGLDEVARYLPPLQTHVILAGVAVAVAMAALALSLRAANTVPDVQLEPRAELTDIAAAYGARPVPGAQVTRPHDPGPPIALADELSDVDVAAMRVSVVERNARIPSARFWLLAFLIAAVASLAGWWELARESEQYNPERLVRMIFNEDWRSAMRRPLHVTTGGAIIFLPLILAMVAAWAPRRKGLILFFSFFLVLAVALQVWLGVLLLWDTSVGPVMSFNEATAVTPSVAVGE